MTRTKRNLLKLGAICLGFGLLSLASAYGCNPEETQNVTVSTDGTTTITCVPTQGKRSPQSDDPILNAVMENTAASQGIAPPPGTILAVPGQPDMQSGAANNPGAVKGNSR